MQNSGYTVSEVSKILGISERAVLYKINSGELIGKKVRQRWVVDLDNARTDSSLEIASEASIPKPSKPSSNQNSYRSSTSKTSESYDFRKLISYQHLQKWYDHPVLRTLEKHRSYIGRCLEEIAIGFYQWNTDEKVKRYNSARNLVASYLNYVTLHPLADKTLQEIVFNALHNEVMGSIIALTKSLEKKKIKRHETH